MREGAADLLAGDGPRYIVLATYRRNGQEVHTPLWCVTFGDRLVIRTGARTGKVKRMRARPQVRLAVSDGRGRPLGPWHRATARPVTDPELCRQLERAFARTYGLAACPGKA